MLQFLTQHGPAFVNRHGLEFRLEAGHYLRVSLPLETKNSFKAETDVLSKRTIHRYR